jgi:hypothetical protein
MCWEFSWKVYSDSWPAETGINGMIMLLEWGQLYSLVYVHASLKAMVSSAFVNLII